MSRKLPPKWVSKVAPEPGPVEGVDNLPIPSGTGMKSVETRERESEATPGAMGVPMTSAQYRRECNGDNPSIKDTDLNSGMDVRAYGSSPSSNPTPDKPGA